eukprot:5917199-Pleurochrysis_carterae.AAC.1
MLCRRHLRLKEKDQIVGMNRTFTELAQVSAATSYTSDVMAHNSECRGSCVPSQLSFNVKS